jgi:anaphase-promoting complex subunit 6
MLDRNFIYAWIGMAHSFAIQDESDQAMSVYRTISRLFPGCYLAHLYMGMEYLRTNNLKTALLSLHQAKQINPNDPLIHKRNWSHILQAEGVQRSEELLFEGIRVE